MTQEQVKEMVRFVGKFILYGVLGLSVTAFVVLVVLKDDEELKSITQQAHEQLCLEEGTYVVGGKDDWVIYCKDRHATVFSREEIE